MWAEDLKLNTLWDSKISQQEANLFNECSEQLNDLSNDSRRLVLEDIQSHNSIFLWNSKIQELIDWVISSPKNFTKSLLTNNLIASNDEQRLCDALKTKFDELSTSESWNFDRKIIIIKLLLCCQKSHLASSRPITRNEIELYNRSKPFDESFVRLLYSFQQSSNLKPDCKCGIMTTQALFDMSLSSNIEEEKLGNEIKSITINTEENLRSVGNINKVIDKWHAWDEFMVIDQKVTKRRWRNWKIYKYLQVISTRTKDRGVVYYLCINDADNVKKSTDAIKEIRNFVPDENSKEDAEKLQAQYTSLDIARNTKDYFAMLESINKKTYLCTSLVTSTVLDWLFSDGFVPKFHLDTRTSNTDPNEFDAWELGLALEEPDFSRVPLHNLSPWKLKSKLLSAPKWSSVSVQFAGSKYKEQWTTHSLVHIGNWVFRDMFGPTVRDIDFKSLSFTETWWVVSYSHAWWKFSFVLWPWWVGAWTGNSELLIPNTDQMSTLDQVKSVHVPYYEWQENHEVAENLRRKYSLPTSYFYAALKTELRKEGYAYCDWDIRKLTEYDRKNLRLQLPISQNSQWQVSYRWDDESFEADIDESQVENPKYVSSQERDIYSKELSTNYGYTIPDEYVEVAKIVHFQEQWQGRKRSLGESVVANSPAIALIASLGWYDKPRSYWPMELQIEQAQLLMEENPNVIQTINKILASEYNDAFAGRTISDSLRIITWGMYAWSIAVESISDISSLDYRQRIYILSNPKISLLLATKKIQWAVSSIAYNARNYKSETVKSDIYTTAMYEYNHGMWNTQSAVLQQYVYWVALRSGYVPPSNSKITVDGKKWGERSHVTQFLKQEWIDIQSSATRSWNIQSITVWWETIGKNEYSKLEQWLSTLSVDIPFSPVLHWQFFNECDMCVHLQYAHEMFKSTEKLTPEDIIKRYRWTPENIQNRFLWNILQYENSYPKEVWTLTQDEMFYDPITWTSCLNCNYFVSLFALSQQWKLWTSKISWREIYDSAWLSTEIHTIFEENTNTAYMINRSIYRDFDSYKNILSNVRAWMIVWIGHQYAWWSLVELSNGSQKKVSMSHGGIVSRVERNTEWEIINVYMMHASGEVWVWWNWVVEVPMFWPWWYYEKVCINNPRKGNIFFGRLQ